MKSFTVLELIAHHSNLVISKIQEEKQNSNYEGMTFFLGHHHIRSRLAKKTPTKKGYFVATWEKDNFNQNKPFDDENSPDLLIISIMDQSKNGVFIFPKSTLVTQKILNSSKTTGKMAFRVYPSWENNLNKTATKTQLWQKAFFIDLSLKIDNQKFSFLLNQR